MPNLYTNALHIRLRPVGSMLPADIRETWPAVLNAELEKIDRVVAEVCSALQIEIIKAKLPSETEGFIL